MNLFSFGGMCVFGSRGVFGVTERENKFVEFILLRWYEHFWWYEKTVSYREHIVHSEQWYLDGVLMSWSFHDLRNIGAIWYLDEIWIVHLLCGMIFTRFGGYANICGMWMRVFELNRN